MLHQQIAQPTAAPAAYRAAASEALGIVKSEMLRLAQVHIDCRAIDDPVLMQSARVRLAAQAQVRAALRRHFRRVL